MRLSGVAAGVDIPSFWKLNRWNYTLYLPLAFVLLRARVLRVRWLVVVVVVALISAVLKFTRAPVLNVVTICIVGMWAVRSETTRPLRGAHRRLAVTLVLLVGFVLLFGGMQAVLVSKMGRGGSRTGEALLAYVGGPLRAYEDVLLNGGWGEYDRIYSIDFVDFVAFKAGLKQGYEGQVRPYTDFGIVTNVYTYLDVFTLDAGIPGALLGTLGLRNPRWMAIRPRSTSARLLGTCDVQPRSLQLRHGRCEQPVHPVQFFFLTRYLRGLSSSASRYAYGVPMASRSRSAQGTVSVRILCVFGQHNYGAPHRGRGIRIR